MSADAYGAHHNPTADSADFCLTPEEIQKGEQAAISFMNSLKPGDGRRTAEEALGTLATVISGGVCDDWRFPWHQVRAYHGALALSLVKERGAPAKVELLRCRHDETRRFQQVPDAYSTKHVQKMRTCLKRVIEECHDLGFIDDDEMALAIPPSKGNGSRKTTRERVLTDGEVQALLSACDLDESTGACRDALMIGLAWHGGLKTVDLINLTLDNLDFDERQGRMTIKVRPPGAKRSRRVPLDNEELIALEDWLELRGRDEGPLFSRVVRGRIEHKRLSATDVKEMCELRAEQAGVLVFAPNDLARSGPHGSEGGKRKRGGNGASRETVDEDSPLWATGAAEEAGTEHIRFPYRVRIGS